MAAGGLFVALDEDEVQHGTVVPVYRDTMAGGLVLAVAGAAVVTAVIVWRTRARKGRTITPAVTYQDKPRVGIAGRF
jgi:hypothetical protein